MAYETNSVLAEVNFFWVQCYVVFLLSFENGLEVLEEFLLSSSIYQ